MKKKIYYNGNNEVGYLYLNGNKKDRKVAKTIWLSHLLDYKGPSLYFDLNSENEILGIEIVD